MPALYDDRANRGSLNTSTARPTRSKVILNNVPISGSSSTTRILL
jgi:hypothetical protein